MENSMTKAITIAVGIFITVAITSGILFSINEMRNIYSQVYETDTSITSRFSEFDAFDDTIVTGVDVINALSKYGSKVSFNGYVEIPNGETASESEKMAFYKLKFDSKVEVTDEENFKIIFTRK